MDINLKIWRQASPSAKGEVKSYSMRQISENMSFLEMLDLLNTKLIQEKNPDGPVAFDSDCREGICGNCGLMVNGRAHGHLPGTTTCQLYMRNFKDGETIYLEPFRARAFPVIKDLVVDREALDLMIQNGGYISVNSGAATDANSLLISKEAASLAMDAASCIGCGACVANCKNASAMLFVSAKVSHLGLLPQGQPERHIRVLNMLSKMQNLGFGNCTNEAECEAGCPKNISLLNIARLNRDFIKAAFTTSEV